jgi:hypothetical protein
MDQNVHAVLRVNLFKGAIRFKSNPAKPTFSFLYSVYHNGTKNCIFHINWFIFVSASTVNIRFLPFLSLLHSARSILETFSTLVSD